MVKLLENYSYVYMLAVIFILVSTILNLLTSVHGIKECIKGFVISFVVLDISILYVLSRFSSHPWIVRWQFFVMLAVFVYAAFSDREIFKILKNKHLRIVCIDIMLYALLEQFLFAGFLNFLFVIFFIVTELSVFGIMKKITNWVKNAVYEFKDENGFLKNKDDRKPKKKYNGSDISNISSKMEKNDNDVVKNSEDDEKLNNDENISKADDDDVEIL